MITPPDNHWLDGWTRIELASAITLSGLDMNMCGRCSRCIVCIPDGLPMCEQCATAEADRA